MRQIKFFIFLNGHDIPRYPSDEVPNLLLNKIVASLSLLSPFNSIVYYGEEIGLPQINKVEHEYPRGLMHWNDDTNLGFSKAMPWMEEFSEEYKDVSISEANEKNIREVLDHFQVKMYPTFVYFSEGKVIDIFFGDTQYDKVREFIEKNI